MGNAPTRMKSLTLIALLILALAPPLRPAQGDAATAAPAPVLLLLADSVGQGVGASDPARGYAALSARQLGMTLDTAGSVRNLPGAWERWRAWRDGHATPPALVVIQVGLNDVSGFAGPQPLGLFRERLAGLVAEVRASGARVVVCTPPWPLPDARWAAGWAAIAADVRAAAGAGELADFYAVTQGRRDYHAGGDGLHPNDAGHAALAAVLVAAAARGGYVVALPLM